MSERCCALSGLFAKKAPTYCLRTLFPPGPIILSALSFAFSACANSACASDSAACRASASTSAAFLEKLANVDGSPVVGGLISPVDVTGL